MIGSKKSAKVANFSSYFQTNLPAKPMIFFIKIVKKHIADLNIFIPDNKKNETTYFIGLPLLLQRYLTRRQ